MSLIKILFLCFCVKSLAFAEGNILEKLMEGNKRFVSHQLELCLNTEKAREESALKQAPLAVVVTCSDARVPPDMIFDQSLGSLFVVRLAGNLIDDFALGSIEYAVRHLKVPFIMVLGHTRCGVIEAFLKKIQEKQHVEGHIEDLLLAVYPAVPNLRDIDHLTVTDLVKSNVLYSVEKLKKSSPILSKEVEVNGLQIVGGIYSLDTGVVTILQ